MPTRKEMPKTPHVGMIYSQIPKTEDTTYNWTDDLPMCKKTGVGFAVNQLYRQDGTRREEHEYEDCFFTICYPDNSGGHISLYGVCDGHDGIQAAHFAAQKIPAELLLGQPLNNKTLDEEVKDVLRQAFVGVEKGYMESIGEYLAERTTLQSELPAGASEFEAYTACPEIIQKICVLNTEIRIGTTALVALLFRNRLYVASVGNSRALLCKTDELGVLRVLQLTVDHTINNEDELLRLHGLGMDTYKLRHGSRLGPHDLTRCIGNYLVKGGYKECEGLADASSEPITSEPEIFGGIPLDDSCRFLLLISEGLYKSLQDSTGTEHVNKEIVKLVSEQFNVQSTLTGVSQAVVDHVCRKHHDAYMGGRVECQQREDITLLLRNFNYPMPNAQPSAQDTTDSFGGSAYSTAASISTSNTNTSTESSEMAGYNPRRVEVGADGRVLPYVDFSQFYLCVEEARQDGVITEDDMLYDVHPP